MRNSCRAVVVLFVAWVAQSALAQEQPAGAADPQTTEERMRQNRQKEWRELSDAPGTSPASSRAFDGPRARGGERRPERSERFDRFDPESPEVLAAVETMKKHSPNWLHRMQGAPPDAPMRRRMMRGIFERHLELQRIKERDPEQYKREIEQLELEDQVLGLARDIRRQEQSSSEESRKQLREKISLLVDVRLRNREARIQRLAETLANERKRLEEAKLNRDEAIDKQVNAVLSGPDGGGGGGLLGGPGRGPGPREAGDPGAPPRPPGDGPPPPGPRPQRPGGQPPERDDPAAR